jgi:hypothetical protein
VVILFNIFTHRKVQQNNNGFDLSQQTHYKLYSSNAISKDLWFTFEELGPRDFYPGAQFWPFAFPITLDHNLCPG